MPTAVGHGSVGRKPGGNAALQCGTKSCNAKRTLIPDWRTASRPLTFRHDGSDGSRPSHFEVHPFLGPPGPRQRRVPARATRHLARQRCRGLGPTWPPLWSLYCLIGEAELQAEPRGILADHHRGSVQSLPAKQSTGQQDWKEDHQLDDLQFPSPPSPSAIHRRAVWRHGDGASREALTPGARLNETNICSQNPLGAQSKSAFALKKTCKTNAGKSCRAVLPRSPAGLGRVASSCVRAGWELRKPSRVSLRAFAPSNTVLTKAESLVWRSGGDCSPNNKTGGF